MSMCSVNISWLITSYFQCAMFFPRTWGNEHATPMYQTRPVGQLLCSQIISATSFSPSFQHFCTADIVDYPVFRGGIWGSGRLAFTASHGSWWSWDLNPDVPPPKSCPFSTAPPLLCSFSRHLWAPTQTRLKCQEAKGIGPAFEKPVIWRDKANTQDKCNGMKQTTTEGRALRFFAAWGCFASVKDTGSERDGRLLLLVDCVWCCARPLHLSLAASAHQCESIWDGCL